MSASSCQAWVFANRDAKGYYRVAYTPEGLKKIAQIAEKQLNVPERIAFLEDAWAMTRATKTSAVDFLAVSQALRGEQNRHVMDLLGTHLRYLKDSAVSADRQQKFDHFVQVQFGALAKKLGWNPLPSDTDDQKALRASLLETLGAAGDQEAVAVARHIVEQYMENPTSVEGTISGPAFAIAAANGSPALYDRFLQALSSSKSSDEYYHYLYALADFAQPQLFERTIALIDQDKVRQQDYPRFFGALLSNPAAREATWRYLKAHWNVLAQKVTSFGGAGAISALGNACSAEMRDDIEQFFGTHPAPGAERAVQQSLERIDSCIDFKHAQASALHEWLSNQQ